MSRSNYSEDGENIGLWRANVERTIGGKRGQAFLREMAAALDAMPVKELIADDFIDENGCACAMGAVAQARKLEVREDLDPGEPREVADLLGISSMLAQEIAYQNDEQMRMIGGDETPAQRWQRMRSWVRDQVRSGQPNSKEQEDR